ncbi:MAG: M28 family peptidase [Candidatus Cloacimonadales bacterium]
MKYFSTMIAALLFLAGCQAVPEFRPEHAFEHLEKQCEMGPRQPNSPEIEICREYIMHVLAKSQAEIIRQDFTATLADSLYHGSNIIGQFYPRQPRRILLAAHYDTRPWADKEPDEAKHQLPIIGANDAASGVAVLLEIAELLAANPPPEFGVDLVFFDLEDMGNYGENDNWCLGSKYFAENLPIRIPEKAIVVDMVGDKDLNIELEHHSYHDSPALVNEIWELAKERGFAAFERKIGNRIYDDHVPLLQVGIEAALIIDFDYPYWHTLEDTPDKCSPQSLKTVGQVLLDLIYQK